MRRLLLCVAALALASLAHAQATAKVIYGVADSPCAPDTMPRYRPTLYPSQTAARIAARAPIQCPVVTPPVVIVPPVVVPPVVPPVVAPSDTTFAPCVNAGARCVFVGVRDVRMVNADGTYFITKESSGGLDCGLYAFTATVAWNPPGGVNQTATSCRVGSLKRVLVSNPFSGMAGTHANFLVQKGDTGVANAQPGTDSFAAGSTPGEGSSRFTCYIAKFGTFDPLVYPGQNNVGHFHMFYGNAGIAPTSTSATLVASGNSTCNGGTLNRTAYWVPALFAYNAANTVDTVPALAWGQVYYKTGYNVNTALTQPFPAGLHMIAGDKSATGSQDINGAQGVSWICRDGSAPNSTDGTIPNCGVNDEVQSWIKFPHCWDGVNLDSPDHKSHMAYPNFRNLWDPSPSRSYCPSTHSVQLPQVTQILRFPVTVANDPLRWRLTCDMNLSSRGGLCAHADWMMAWDVPTMQKLVTNCLQAQKDCQVGYVGSGLPLLYQKP